MIAALLILSGWATVRYSWSEGLPWWSGFRAEYLATPIAASIAAVVAITTAWWGVRNAHATRDAEHQRWEEERRESTERTLRDRFHELIKLLSADDLRSREGAAYALAALADDWKAHYGPETDKARAEQQVCIDVLISQLRDPISAQAGDPQQIAFKQVVQKIISARLGQVVDGGAQPGDWSAFDLIFDGCYLHDIVLQNRVCTGDVVSFDGTYFSGKWASFTGTHFSGARVSFSDARFTTRGVVFAGTFFGGRRVSFNHAQFSAKSINFNAACVTSESITFEHAQLEADIVSFNGASFMCPFTKFNGTRFVGDWLSFDGATFSGRAVTFNAADIDMRHAIFDGAHFNGASVSFARGTFHVCRVSFDEAHIMARVVANGLRLDDCTLTLNGAITTATQESLAALVDPSRFEDEGARFEVERSAFPACEECSKPTPTRPTRHPEPRATGTAPDA